MNAISQWDHSIILGDGNLPGTWQFMDHNQGAHQHCPPGASFDKQ